MAEATPNTDQTADGTERARSRNLRQLLLRASRRVNRDVVEGLRARGHSTLRAAHTTLLSNMPLAGGTITAAADQAGISKQAMGRLAAELESQGFLRVEKVDRDRRERRLQLTESGLKLMLESLEVMEELERRYAEQMGLDRLSSLMNGLGFLAWSEKPCA